MAGMFLSLQSTRVSIHSIHASQICVGGINETWIKFDLKKKKKTSLKGALLSPLTPPLFLAYFLLMFLGKHQSVGATGLAGGQSHDGMLARSGSRSATLWAQQQMGVGGAETHLCTIHTKAKCYKTYVDD